VTYDQAIVVRTLQLQGKPVGRELLAEAIEVIRRTKTPTAWPDQSRPRAAGGQERMSA
jgi:hypothetical protein